MMENHMQQHHQLPEQAPPPTYARCHDSQSFHLPSIPQHDPSSNVHHDRQLPPISSILPEQRRPIDEPLPSPWNMSSNPLAPHYHPAHTSPKTRSALGRDSPSAMDIDVATPDSRRAESVLSLDDPDVRLAAEALGDLRAADYHSPRPDSANLPQSRQRPEPLLSLLTTSHPIVGTAINNSISAYSAGKNYSPRFKSGAEYVEKRFSPVVNTVGTINRVTGVEGGVRWFLGGRRPSHHKPADAESDLASHKRRRVNGGMDIDPSIPTDPYPVYRSEALHHRERRASQGSTVESLPAYDEHRSPSYEANEQALITHSSDQLTTSSSWQSRLMLSTSGLSIAMSEESLRSLKYCLGWLKWANEHIGKVIDALRAVLEEYDSEQWQGQGTIAYDNEKGGQLVLRGQNADRQALNERVTKMKADVLKTLKDVVDVVSKYAGGALPENARVLVRRHLTSLPARFKKANHTASGEKTVDGEAKEGARKVMLLAKEGLDMMAQVSGVLDGTIVSAEEWCDRLGRRNRGEPEDDTAQHDYDSPAAVTNGSEDVKMG